MDDQTLNAYNDNAASYAAKYAAVQTPEVLQDIIPAFFWDGEPTADIGCGIGRDAAWLAAEGYAVDGYDASDAMLAEARSRYPAIRFEHTELPNLALIADGSYPNVLCSAVLMHLPAHELVPACINLLRILRDEGILVISIRGSRVESERESDGRLYSDINTSKLGLMFSSLGGEVLNQYAYSDQIRRDISWTTLVIVKSGSRKTRGLFRLQEILTLDYKTSTYKFALIRALCATARLESGSVRWHRDVSGDDYVTVPLRGLAVWWVKYFWPLIIENQDIRQTAGGELAFSQLLRRLSTEYGPDGLPRLISDFEGAASIPGMDELLKKISRTIRDQPVKYAGGGDNPLFAKEAARRGDRSEPVGFVRVPAEAWRDISLFGHWIDESVLIQWAKWSVDKNKHLEHGLGYYVQILSAPLNPKRTTAEVRELIHASHPRRQLRCVWSGALLDTKYDIDHLIPYSVWFNNDLWNLLPASSAVNNKKRDKIPTYQLIEKRKDAIIEYWSIYRGHWPRFDPQLRRSLHAGGGAAVPLDSAVNGLIEVAERLARATGMERFSG